MIIDELIKKNDTIVKALYDNKEEYLLKNKEVNTLDLFLFQSELLSLFEIYCDKNNKADLKNKIQKFDFLTDKNLIKSKTDLLSEKKRTNEKNRKNLNTIIMKPIRKEKKKELVDFIKKIETNLNFIHPFNLRENVLLLERKNLIMMIEILKENLNETKKEALFLNIEEELRNKNIFLTNGYFIPEDFFEQVLKKLRIDNIEEMLNFLTYNIKTNHIYNIKRNTENMKAYIHSSIVNNIPISDEEMADMSMQAVFDSMEVLKVFISIYKGFEIFNEFEIKIIQVFSLIHFMTLKKFEEANLRLMCKSNESIILNENIFNELIMNTEAIIEVISYMSKGFNNEERSVIMNIFIEGLASVGYMIENTIEEMEILENRYKIKIKK